MTEVKKKQNVSLIMEGGSDIEDTAGHDLLLKKVATFTALPTIGESDGDTYLVLDEDTLYEWDATLSNWVVPAANAKGFTSGCRLAWNSTANIYVQAGNLTVSNRTLEKTSDLYIGFEALESGSVKKANTWYYVYLEQDPTNAKTYRAFISEQMPSKDQYGNGVSPDVNKAKYHTTRPARFVGSFRTDSSQNIMRFKVNGNYVAYIGLGYNYILSGGNKTTKTAVNCRGFVPQTSSLCNVYWEFGSGSNTRYVGDSTAWYLKAVSGAGTLIMPVTNDSVYYQCSGSNTVSLGIHGYYEDI